MLLRRPEGSPRFIPDRQTLKWTVHAEHRPGNHGTALYLPLTISEKTTWRRGDWPFCSGHQQLARSSRFRLVGPASWKTGSEGVTDSFALALTE